ncbi:MAG: hypothetical protein P8124_06765 [Gammaproteobacteria bacterium]
MNPSITRLLRPRREEPASTQVGKVAAVTLSFWIVKTLLTTAGDVSGDLLSATLGLGYVASLLVASAFVVSLATAQLRTTGFSALAYWSLIFGTSTLGTELSDAMDRGLHVGYVGGAVVFLLCLIVTLALWHRRRGAISVYPVHDNQGALFYWATAILANSLGSVLGDLVGDRFGLGVVGGLSINAGILGIVLLLHYTTRINKALVFWSAFVFTRV